MAALITGAVAPLGLGDPGARAGGCRWSRRSAPSRRATVGLLGLAAFLMPERSREPPGHRHRYAAGAATIWAIAALLEVVLAFADLAGTP